MKNNLELILKQIESVKNDILAAYIEQIKIITQQDAIERAAKTVQNQKHLIGCNIKTGSCTCILEDISAALKKLNG